MDQQVSLALCLLTTAYFFLTWSKFQEPDEYPMRVLILIAIVVLIQSAAAFIKSLLAQYLRLLVIGTLISSAVGFLFGAPIDTNLLLWGCLVTVLNIIPSINLSTYTLLTFSDVQIGVALACVWVSAFVIPLDWDRPWQVWPVCCTYGAAAGNILSTAAYYVIKHANRNNKKNN